MAAVVQTGKPPACYITHLSRYRIHKNSTFCVLEGGLEATWRELAYAGNSPLHQKAHQLFAKIACEQLLNFNQASFTKEKFQESILFFLSPFPSASNPTPVQRIIKTVERLGGNLEDKINVIEEIFSIAFRQHLFDPLEYCSHGFDHALNVADYCIMAFENNPQIKKVFYEKITNDRKSPLIDIQYHCLLELLSYFHDCGYPHLQGREKANHAPYSAFQVERTLKIKLKPVLVSVVGNEYPKLYEFLHTAVFTHNADGGKEEFDSVITCSSGSFLVRNRDCKHILDHFSQPEPFLRTNTINVQEMDEEKLKEMKKKGPLTGRIIDLVFPNDAILGSRKFIAILSENPLHIIRIGDNMDVTRFRLTEFQRSEAFKKVLECRHKIGQVQERLAKFLKETEALAKKTKFPMSLAWQECFAKTEIYKKAVDEVVRKLENQCDVWIKYSKYKENFTLVNRNVNEFSFRHFAGCRAIEKVTKIDITADSTIVHIQCSVEWESLSSQEFYEKEVLLNGAIYQLARTWDAFKAVKINPEDKPLSHIVHFVDIHAPKEVSFTFPDDLDELQLPKEGRS